MSLARDPDLPPQEGEPADEEPADLADDTASDIGFEIRNGDLTADQADPTAVAPTSDPDPSAIDADFGGRPLSEAEAEALPLEEAVNG